MHEMGKVHTHGAVKLRSRGHTALSAAAGRSARQTALSSDAHWGRATGNSAAASEQERFL